MLRYASALLLLLALTACGGAPAGTPAPASTPVPATPATPTAPPPGVGGTLSNFQDWTLSLAQMESRERLVYTALPNFYTPSGKFWFLWLDARNQANASRSLVDTVDSRLTDDHQATYVDFSEGYCEGTSATAAQDCTKMAAAALLEKRDRLDTATTPRALTHPILIFDVAADAVPAQLHIYRQGEKTGGVVFDLAQK
jgi:hypothetical protein